MQSEQVRKCATLARTNRLGKYMSLLGWLVLVSPGIPVADPVLAQALPISATTSMEMTAQQRFLASIWADFILASGGQNLRVFPVPASSDPVEDLQQLDVIVGFQLQRQSSAEPVVQLMTFRPRPQQGFELVWTGDPIPGQLIDMQVRSDLTDQATPKVVLLTERGGVGTLRTVSVLEYLALSQEFGTLLAVRDVPNAVVKVTPGNLLVTTESLQPAGVNSFTFSPTGSGSGQAILFQWQGDRFERFEL